MADPGHVHVALQADVRYSIRANFLNQAIQLSEIDITLEWMTAFRVVGFIDDHVDESTTGQFLVQTCGGEVHVARHEVTRLYHDLRHQVLGTAPLVGGHQVLVAVVLSDSVL